MVGNRYRVVAMLGRGGMGEVYRADDLKLGQAVALKFLPESSSRDSERLSRLLHEVRTARQIAHPNVCRVYDVGEVDGEHFLSMEFVAGEDLASLLRRIGRLPDAKALQVARQICAGLSAAHERGVLHRDLKPANVMLDERGTARLMDFGLAELAEGLPGAKIREGTPAYMAPEQLAGRGVSVRSDLYSLGLLLYEIFTGRFPFDSATIPDLVKERDSSKPRDPSTLVAGLDPAIGRTILKCLERNPEDRPSSAAAVAALLPGGDPLAAAIAAGETPSPEMVAAAGGAGGLRPAVAGAIFVAILAGLVTSALLFHRFHFFGKLQDPKSTEVLTEKAREIIQKAGYVDSPRDWARGFSYDSSAVIFAASSDLPGRPADSFADDVPPAIYFWYRQSPRPLAPSGGPGDEGHLDVVSLNDPAPTLPGMISVRLDTSGRLLELSAVPDASRPAFAGGPDWSLLLSAAGLDSARSATTEPKKYPPVFAEGRRAWTAARTLRPDVALRVEAASAGGRPVWFSVSGPWTPAARSLADAEGESGALIGLILTLTVLIGGSYLAWRNVRLGRGDTVVARRLAGVIFVVTFGSWIIRGSHVAGGAEMRPFYISLSIAIGAAVRYWINYLAIEPYLRRTRPQTLIGWTRLFSGRFFDARVGRELLFGALYGVSIFAALAAVAATIRRGFGSRLMFLENLGGVHYQAAELLENIQIGVFRSLVWFILFLVLRFVLKRDLYAALGACLLLTPVAAYDNPPVTALSVFYWGLLAASVALIFLRGGLLAGATGFFVLLELVSNPVTLDLREWYSGAGLFAILATLCVAIFGLGVSTRRPKLAREA